MINESALLESKTLRNSVLDRTDVLDRVKALSLLPDGMHVTTAMVAAYFSVTVEAIRALVHDHRAELETNGYRVLAGTELSDFKQLSGIQSRTGSLALFPRRAVLNVAMLLRDSEVARQVRVYLLDMEYLARTQPVDNSVHTDVVSLDDRIDQRITHILGKTVVPMFNALIASSSEHRRELISLRQDIENVEQRLCWHHRRLSALEGDAPTDSVRASLSSMTWQALERHVADLLRRDGCTDVVVRQARSDRGIDVTGRTADGRTLAVQCKNRAGRATVPSADMQKFAGAARAVDRVNVALFVATCNFSVEAQAIADLSGVITVDRDELEAWSAGARLKVLR
ncbi:restriction endonuclease [Streptomyces diastatochromogenes]|uniref:Restriction endonuclease n=1 Tax=Streptomyces diastatochromogenes TaxID=42236 RepID=A0A233SBQ6_STRDA|nr:restriction endonuclease [Streptomyces diastatochromogenes]MCZ0988111.1 restriction endonuclease [Streptomyces diastatochromogenes]OXY93090.1 restriction endonuclease [Streptomyces diastatochromogenes]